MIFDANEFARAVMFFDSAGQITKEMHFAEFQAVMDEFVPLKDLAGRDARTVYLEFDSDFLVRRAVFFRIPINSAGEILRSWRLPLADLAASGVKGPNLGGGSIQLTSASYCASSRYVAQLWDPDFQSQNSVLNAIVAAVRRNKIGIQFRSPEDEGFGLSGDQRAKMEQEMAAKLRQEYAKEFREHMTEILKQQTARLEVSHKAHAQEHNTLRDDYEGQLRLVEQKLAAKEHAVQDQRVINDALEAELERVNEKLVSMREYFEQKLSQAGEYNENDLGAVKLAAEAELSKGFEEQLAAANSQINARYEEEIKRLNDTLQMREVELLYRNELEAQLQQDLTQIRAAHNERAESARGNDGTALLEALAEQGVALVSFQPGSGHLTIPVDEAKQFLSNPVAYTAGKCGVSEDCYQQWLAHYNMPVCGLVDAEGNVCGENIERVELPAQFVIGESDCCPSCFKKKPLDHLKVAGQ